MGRIGNSFLRRLVMRTGEGGLWIYFWMVEAHGRARSATEVPEGHQGLWTGALVKELALGGRIVSPFCKGQWRKWARCCCCCCYGCCDAGREEVESGLWGSVSLKNKAFWALLKYSFWYSSEQVNGIVEGMAKRMREGFEIPAVKNGNRLQIDFKLRL